MKSMDINDNKIENFNSTFFNLEEYSEQVKKYIASLSIQGKEERAIAVKLELTIITALMVRRLVDLGLAFIVNQKKQYSDPFIEADNLDITIDSFQYALSRELEIALYELRELQIKRSAKNVCEVVNINELVYQMDISE